MKLAPQFCGGLFALALAVGAFGQGTFQNLGFESPALPLAHVGGWQDFVAASNAIPGWTAYLGTNQQDALLFNNYYLGTAVVGLLGPGLTNTFPTFPRIIDGSYTITLQAGVDPLVAVDPPTLDAAIGQSSLVPVSARSLQLKVYSILGGSHSQFTVSLDGQMINMLSLGNTANYSLYGGDITRFAGLTAELRIAAIDTPSFHFSALALDSIEFSPQAVPEPGAFSVFGLGALFLGWRLSRKARS